ncbi:MAG: hypothetical protein HY055_04075 [Magnetospirillum sp.]|nr:hypothetical protein [Magnetospirillum sp.]
MLTGLYQIAFATGLMTLLGRLVLRRPEGIGLQVMAGWGLSCLVLTLWGVALPLSLRLPAWGLVAAAAAGLALTRHKPWRSDLAEAGKLLALAAPLLWVMAPMEASQLDVFALILPNAAYLVDHAAFPHALGPAAFSDAPVAPYNTGIVPFLGSLAGGGFAANGIALFTVVLHLPAAWLLGRALAGGKAPGWGLAAFGLLLATGLNPGFVPRVSFAGYGEAPLAIALMFAVWLGAQVLEDLSAEHDWPPALIPLALILVVLVAIKQQSIGLFLSLAGAGLVMAGLTLPRSRWWPGLRALTIACLPALLLYLSWRAHVVWRFPTGELISDTAGAWRDARLSEILRDMAWVIGNKLFLFGPLLLVLGLALRPPARLSSTTRMIVRLTALTSALFTLFLLATFLLHFGREHSYFRYSTQLSQAMVLALVLCGRDLARQCPPLPPVWNRILAGLAVALMLAAPVAGSILLRFDRDMPQPLLRFVATHLAAELRPDDRIALILPGDNGTSGMALESLLRFAPPRRPNLSVSHHPAYTPGLLSELAAQGVTQALLSCTDAAQGALGLPPGAAALLRWESGMWNPVRLWPYPASAKRGKWGWTNFIAEEPFCLGTPSGGKG